MGSSTDYSLPPVAAFSRPSIEADEKQATFMEGGGSRLSSRLSNGKRNHNLRQHHQPQYRGEYLMAGKNEVVIKDANKLCAQIKNATDQEGARLEGNRIKNASTPAAPPLDDRSLLCIVLDDRGI